MQVLSAMRVMCVFLTAVAVTDGYYQMNGFGNRGYSMMNHHPYPVMNQQYSNQGYSNNNGNRDSGFNSMQYLPFIMGNDNGKQLATYSMFMNNGQGYLPYYLMKNGFDNAWPMMALLGGGRGGRGFNPFMMATMQDFMN